jgi:hypothetical protein
MGGFEKGDAGHIGAEIVGTAGIGVNLYPWDVVGDPDCAARVKELGADRVTLAAAYHTVRALTPQHPEHKVVTAAHSAVYYRPERRHWLRKRLQPVEAFWSPRSFPQAAGELGRVGLKVYAWVVLAHNQRLGTLHPEDSVINAYGDHYPWALCISSEEVRDYCAALAAEIAGQDGIDGIELESCGWYGFDHLHAHDKTGGVACDATSKLLLSLCFCAACQLGYKDAGIDGEAMRAAVVDALDAVIAGAGVSAALADPELSAAVATMRTRAAERFRDEVIGAVRAARPDLTVLVHAQPDPLALSANPGATPASLFGQRGADGAVVPCNVRSEAAIRMVRAYADQAGPRRAVAATVSAVAGMGADRTDLPAWCADLLKAGASELRFYHAGLASRADLAAVREAAASALAH